MSCGNNFCVVVTDNYKTYSWGINKCGELGLGTPQILGKLPFIEEPREIASFTGKTIGNFL